MCDRLLLCLVRWEIPKITLVPVILHVVLSFVPVLYVILPGSFYLKLYISCLMEIFQKQPHEVFHEKSVLKNFIKFTGKHLYQSLFFNKVAGFRPATY